MSEKSVIIGGVDVSGCEFSCENPLHEIKHSCNVRGCEKDNGLHIHLQCKNNPNCYYKQLQRLKEELNNYKTSKENSYKNLQKEWQQCQWDVRKLTTENERLKEEKSKLLSKCINKQCRINELQQICAIKEFSLKVNGKEYKNLSGIDKAKLFINSENAVRDRYIQKLENKMSDLQCKFYENCKEVVDVQKQIDKYRQALQEIKEIADIIANANCNCVIEAGNIIKKINEVIGAEE